MWGREKACRRMVDPQGCQRSKGVDGCAVNKEGSVLIVGATRIEVEPEPECHAERPQVGKLGGVAATILWCHGRAARAGELAHCARGGDTLDEIALCRLLLRVRQWEPAGGCGERRERFTGQASNSARAAHSLAQKRAGYPPC